MRAAEARRHVARHAAETVLAPPAAVGRRGPSVCMIAYTDYAVDARVRREAETLAANGFRVRCLTTCARGEKRRFVLHGVEVQELAVRKYRGKSALIYLGSYGLFLAACSVACIRLLLRRELDVVHVHNLPDFLVFAGLVPRLFGTKVVLDVHDSVPETFATKFSAAPALQRLLRLEERMSALVAHRVISVNELQRAALAGRGIPDRKLLVSMNVPDPRIFRPRPSVSAKAGDEFHLIYHGTMVDRLGVDLLIRAVSNLRPRIPSLRLHLWGHGDDLPAFQRLARELGVTDCVDFRPKGFPLEELPDRLASMDVGVIGNRRSVATDLMLPVKLMEYVALGIPVVAPRLKAIEHYFSNGVALYDAEDERSLAVAIERLYRDPAARQQQAERASRALDEHRWERKGPELAKTYLDLVER